MKALYLPDSADSVLIEAALEQVARGLAGVLQRGPAETQDVS